MLEINPGLVVWTTITFVLLVIVLKKVAWKPILEALEKREEHIRLSIEKAEQGRTEAERLLEQHRQQLASAETEAHKIIKESRELAQKLKAEIEETAKKQAHAIVSQAKAEIERDKDAALAQLRGEVADLAILAAGKILNETLDANRHRKLVDDVLKSLPKN
ncbi:MAG: F0F1 ATP synthase subunit B [Ignavibacteriae bacterium]|nr:F0F1 ATP synthase subunit B [Ignavibacteriota bacterium]